MNLKQVDSVFNDFTSKITAHSHNENGLHSYYRIKLIALYGAIALLAALVPAPTPARTVRSVCTVCLCFKTKSNTNFDSKAALGKYKSILEQLHTSSRAETIRA